MNDLIEEKMKTVLNLIRTNNSADDALKITQAMDNLARAKRTLSDIETDQGGKPTRTKGSGA